MRSYVEICITVQVTIIIQGKVVVPKIWEIVTPNCFSLDVCYIFLHVTACDFIMVYMGT